MTDAGTKGLRAIAEQAADWYLRMEDEGQASLAERQRFVAWLKASPAHIEEFMRVRATHTQLSGLDANSLPDADELLREAESNVIALAGELRDELRPLAKAAHKPLARAMAASIVAVVVTLGFMALRPTSMPTEAIAGTVYETTLGEQRSVLLSDGSVVELNTQSTLRILFSDATRLVELAAGEAVFDVAEDIDRPFRVDAGTAIVEAVGTRFNVYRQSSRTIVTVVEGRVDVSRPAPPTARRQGTGAVAELPVVRLAVGDQVAVSSGGTISLPAAVDTQKAIAWTDRRLVFDGDTLATVAQELNRYNRQQLTIADATLAQQAISGVFNANDPQTLFAFLEAVGGLRVETDPAGEGWTVYPAAESTANPEQR